MITIFPEIEFPVRWDFECIFNDFGFCIELLECFMPSLVGNVILIVFCGEIEQTETISKIDKSFC